MLMDGVVGTFVRSRYKRPRVAEEVAVRSAWVTLSGMRDGELLPVRRAFVQSDRPTADQLPPPPGLYPETPNGHVLSSPTDPSPNF